MCVVPVANRLKISNLSKLTSLKHFYIERETQRQRDRERETDRQRDRETDRERNTERQRQTDRHTERECFPSACGLSVTCKRTVTNISVIE